MRKETEMLIECADAHKAVEIFLENHPESLKWGETLGAMAKSDANIDDDLLSAYVAESGNLLKVVDEDAEGGIELRELLETKHSSAVELRFSYSFAELAKEVIIDQGKRITAEEAIKRYGFLRLIDDIFAQKCYVFKDYALDIIGEYHEKYDDDEKNDYYDDEHSYAHTIKRLAEPGYHMTQVELIEKLAKSDCFPEGAAL